MRPVQRQRQARGPSGGGKRRGSPDFKTAPAQAGRHFTARGGIPGRSASLRALLLCAALALAGPVAATQEAVPGLYDVTGVAAGDALNVRADPDPHAPILGTLARDARAVEVVALDASGRWARVNLGERGGWVARRFLAVRAGEWQGRIPAGLDCTGTEPFWRLEIGPEGQRFEAAGETPLRYGGGARLPAEGRRDRWALRAWAAGRGLTAVVAERACSDGMSGRAYGLGVDLILSDRDGARYLSGCCSLVP